MRASEVRRADDRRRQTGGKARSREHDCRLAGGCAQRDAEPRQPRREPADQISKSGRGQRKRQEGPGRNLKPAAFEGLGAGKDDDGAREEQSRPHRQ